MSTAILPHKVAMLIPRLGSSFDAEIVGTVKAIERTLKAAGLDWHDLAHVIDAPPLAPRHQHRPGHDAQTWREMVAHLYYHDRALLDDQERAFVAQHEGVARRGHAKAT